MSKLNNSLSKKLSLDILLMAIPVFVLSLGIFYLQSRYLIREESKGRSNSILGIAMQRVQNYMGSIETSTNANAWLLEENFTPSSLQAITKRIVGLNPSIINCSVSAEPGLFPQYGRFFTAYTFRDEDSLVTVFDTNYEYTDKAWYKEPLNKGKACWVDPFSEYTQGLVDHNGAVATYCRPLCSEGGQILGVISADFSFSKLAKTVNSITHPYPDAFFMLLGADGRYLVHPDSTRLFRKTIFTDADPLQNADQIALGHEMTDGKEGTMHVMVNGLRCHVCYQPVAGTNWSLAMVCPESEILFGYYRLAYVIIAIILVGLLAMLWLCHKVVHQTIRPINQLLGYTQSIADGDYDKKIPLSEQNDDVGNLQNGFAAMQQALHNHIGRISNTAEEIRKHNEQRAREMEQAEEAVRKKNLFIQNLSHQIRTPLSIIMGFANMLRDNILSRSQGTGPMDKFVDESLSESANMMMYNAIHLKRMVLMLFDSSSATDPDELASNRTDEVKCNVVARESIKYTEEHFHGVTITMESELDDGVTLLTNHLYLVRTIRELLYNAAKYSDGQHIRLQLTETATTVRFTVVDTGPGLPGNVDELLYKPFVKMDDFSEGLGLGLPLSKRHALSMGGDLIYDRDYHDGCRFTLELPK